MRCVRDVVIIALRASDPTDNLLIRSQKLAVLMNSLSAGHGPVQSSCALILRNYVCNCFGSTDVAY
jgi:hypothetical protein